MSEIMSPEVLAKLEMLGQKLGANSTEVFSWYVTQQYIEVFGILAIVIFGAISAFACKKWYLHANKKYEKKKANAIKHGGDKPEDNATFAPVLFGIISSVFAVGGIVSLIFNVVCLANAEYYAFKDLIVTISNMVP